MSALRMFIPITKVDTAQRLVYGVATADIEDRAGEICDYESTRPLYEKWSNAIAKSTGGKSLGNLRAMHGPVAAGKVTTINFNDRDKQIEVCAKVVDDAEWTKVKEGVYTGFSQGGSYVKRWTDSDGRTRYTAEPKEISLVDLPCLPEACFEMIKADGTSELRRFAKEAHDAENLDDLLHDLDDLADPGSANSDAFSAASLRDILLRAIAALREAARDMKNEPESEEDERPTSSMALSPTNKISSSKRDALTKSATERCEKDEALRLNLHHGSAEPSDAYSGQKALSNDLEKRFESLTATTNDILQRVKRIEAQPLPLPLAGRARAISKSEEAAGDLQAGDAIEELLSDPDALSLLAIKMAQRNRYSSTR